MADKPNIEQSTPRFKDQLNARQIVLPYRYIIITFILIIVIHGLIYNSKLASLINLIMLLCYGAAVCILIISLSWLFKPEWDNRFSTFLILTSSVIGGAIIHLEIGFFILRRFFSIKIPAQSGFPFQAFLFTVVLGGIVTYFIYSNAQLKAVRKAIEKEKVNRLASEKAVIESNLRLLQAQIEPQFLFNTLSNIMGLIDTEPAKGKSMLIDLTRYLRTSLSRTLSETTTLGQEMDMITDYLNIQKIRMGERLNFIIKVPDALLGLSFPPMLLQPLVENAVRHGLEPKIEGGEILITASQDNHLLKVAVADTGMGFSSLNSSGVGLANVRERMGLLFGEKGRFIIEENHPCGVKAVIEAPIND